MNDLDALEADYLPPDVDVTHYTTIRNAIISLWRKDVSKDLSIIECLGKFRMRDQPYALAAWRYLNALGFINFGVNAENQERVASGKDDKGTVVVIGAGVSGLVTARQLRSSGYRVVVVEGSARPGGRVYTERLSSPDGKHSVVADVGGSIITGVDGNPIAVIAKQMNIPMAHIRDQCPLYMPDGSEANELLDTLVEDYYNNVLMKGCAEIKVRGMEEAKKMSLATALEKLWDEKYPELEHKLQATVDMAEGVKAREGLKMDPGPVEDAPEAKLDARSNGHGKDKVKTEVKQLFDWHRANLEFANSCLLETVSMMYWDQDDPDELPGAHAFLPGCNGRWIKALAQGLAIFYNNPVTDIRYSKDEVAVHTPTQEFRADAVVVTVPLGVLKLNTIRFHPPLPHRKRLAISRLGFGVMNKVIMMFPYVFWGREQDMFGHIAEEASSRGDAFLFYSYADISGGAQLTALIAGSAAEEQEVKEPTECVMSVMKILRSIFERKGIQVPAPLHCIVTRWGSDPMARGAYSSLSVGSRGGEDYDIMAENVGSRVFFAGEATVRRYPATMHGAFFSGLYTSADVDSTLSQIHGKPMASVSETAAAVKKIVATQTKRALARGTKKYPPLPPHVASMQQPKQEQQQEPGEQKKQQPKKKQDTRNHVSGARPPLPPAVTPSSTAPLSDSLHAEDNLIQEMILLASRLKMIFGDPQHGVDLDLGKIKVVYQPPPSHKTSAATNPRRALLRIELAKRNISDSGENQDQRPILIYKVVDLDLAKKLSSHPDDDSRLAALSKMPAINLTDREGLGKEGTKLVEQILKWRRDNSPLVRTGVGIAAEAKENRQHAAPADASPEREEPSLEPSLEPQREETSPSPMPSFADPSLLMMSLAAALAEGALSD